MKLSIVLFAAVLSIPAHAEIIRYGFSGAVDVVINREGGTAPVAQFDKVSGWFDYNNQATFVQVLNGDSLFTGVVPKASLSVNGYTWNWDNSFAPASGVQSRSTVHGDRKGLGIFPNDMSLDNMTGAAYRMPFTGLTRESASLQISLNRSTPFSGPILPASLLGFEGGTIILQQSGRLGTSSPGFLFSLDIGAVSVVPEPTPFALMIGGLLGLRLVQSGARRSLE